MHKCTLRGNDLSPGQILPDFEISPPRDRSNSRPEFAGPHSVAPCGRLRTLLQRPTQSSVSLVLAPNSLRSISRGQTEPAANLGQHHGCPPVIRCRILRPGQATSAESPVTADAHVPYCVDPD